MTQLPVASFTAGHTVRTHSQGLSVIAPDGTHRATFPGAGAHRAVIDANGLLSIFAAASHTRDEDRLLRLQDELRRINSDNAEFWATREGMPE
jgi:hypothetical protein